MKTFSYVVASLDHRQHVATNILYLIYAKPPLTDDNLNLGRGKGCPSSF